MEDPNEIDEAYLDKHRFKQYIESIRQVRRPTLHRNESVMAFNRIERAISDILSQAETEVNDL